MIRRVKILLLVAMAASAGACAPRSDTAATPVAAGAVTARAEATASPPAPPPSPAAATSPAPAISPATANAATGAHDLLACQADADCAIKDVGSCCGARPACVNKDAKTFPEQVKARCAAEGRMSTCGFTAIEGCTCQAGQCAPIVAGPAAPEPVR